MIGIYWEKSITCIPVFKSCCSSSSSSSSGSSINYPCWQTAWCGCGTGFADAAVGTCPGICSNKRVFQSPSWWPQPWYWFPLSSPATRYLTENKLLLNVVSAQINFWQTSHAGLSLISNFPEESSCTHSLLLNFKASWIVSRSDPLHWETNKCLLTVTTPVLSPQAQTSAPPFHNQCPPPLKFPTARSQRHDVRNTVWVCILNDRKAVPVPSTGVHQKEF